ncbi:MAG: hypothetical protein ACOX3G_11005 [Armatimonadota bacterium]|jgi:protein arginine kinase activator
MIVLRRRPDGIDRTFVCSECASERAKLYAGTGFDFERVMTRVEEETLADKPGYGCRVCGCTIADIIADGRPGCCGCYSRFSDEIRRSIKRAQGQARHLGKAPLR